MEIRLGPGVPLAIKQRFPEAQTVEAQITSDHVECASCGSSFPTSEAAPGSGGYCECGGELVLRLEAAARVLPSSQTVEFTVVKDSDG